MDVAEWLQDLGLERYVSAFRDNEIDWKVLPKLTSEDLREIGVAAIERATGRAMPGGDYCVGASGLFRPG